MIMIGLVKELVCDHSECNSLLHFDSMTLNAVCMRIAEERYDWRIVDEIKMIVICPNHDERKDDHATSND